MSFLFGNRSNRTFKPKKNIPEGTHQYDLMKQAAATLGSGDLRLAVMLPEGEDLNEWIAVNIVDFFNQINMLYGTITEFCTEEICPLMSAGPKYEYHWADGTTVKKPIKCSAPKYIDYLMTWVQDQLDDESIFPSKIGVPFPKHFISTAKTILKRLFRVYAHIYHQHFHQVVQLDEEAHLNTSFKHFIFFVQEFGLIDKRELAPLSDLIEKLIEKRDGHANNSSTTINNSGHSTENRHHHHPNENLHHHISSEQPTIHNKSGGYYPQNVAVPSYHHQPRILMSRLPPSHPPPHYPMQNNNKDGSRLPPRQTLYHQPTLPSKPPQATPYYNVAGSGSNTNVTTTSAPAYHQHLQKQRNVNAGSGPR